ncbi:hypothetical protein P3S68_007941 [Capsicum galapagoense]
MRKIILEGKCGDWLVCGAIFGPTQQTAGTLANQVPSSSTAVASINSSCDTISSQYRGLPKKYSSMMVTGVQYEVFSLEDEDVCPPHALKRILSYIQNFLIIITSAVYMSGR